MYARALRALLRDTISPDVIHAGVKYNVIPGDAVIEVDCRILPGHDRARDRAPSVERRRPGPAAGLRHRADRLGRAGRVAGRGPALGHARRDAPRPRPDGDPAAGHGPVRDRRQDDRPMVGIPTYGFSPLRLEPDERFLERFHGVDERVSLDALRFGLPVLYDVVRRFCG